MSFHPSFTLSRLLIQITRRGGIGLIVLVTTSLAAQTHGPDLTHATVIVPGQIDSHESAAIQLLTEEVTKRTGFEWTVRTAPLQEQRVDPAPRIWIGRRDQLGSLPRPLQARQANQRFGRPESFRVVIAEPNSRVSLVVEGSDDRGVLFGIGWLLRHVKFSRGRAQFMGPKEIESAPQFSIRGHQLGYRFKNNTYDAWSPARFEQYIRDLAVFGANTIEILPPVTDDAPSSPLFPLPAMEMMKRISGLVEKYGLRCSVYYPALASDYRDPSTIESELRVWGEVFRQLPQIDELFVPGGDPGHTDPAVLFPFLEKVAGVLHRFHPQAKIWVSAQGFNADQMRRFYALVNAQPSWLTGIVVGPQSRDGLELERSKILRRYPIRFYPDIAHTMHSQLPIPEWDEAFALTEGREVINPRPIAETAIFRHYAPSMAGFVTYSEGVNDDVNKFVWNALGWTAHADIRETMDEYSRYFIGDTGFSSAGLSTGIFALEKNWKVPLLGNVRVEATLKAFEDLESQATSEQRANWRFEAALYRARTDAYERNRLLVSKECENNAFESLVLAPRIGSMDAMRSAEAAFAPLNEQRSAAQAERSKIEDLAGLLFDHIGLQLSVSRFGASAVDRGASFDTLDVSLDDHVWLGNEFKRIRLIDNETDRLKELLAIVHWQDPGPGGFYDDLGDPQREPHLLRGPGYPNDPAFIETAQDGVADRTPDQGWKVSQLSYAGALYDHPLSVRYSDLSPEASYKIRIVYAGEDYTVPTTLIANGTYVIHGPRLRKTNPETVEFAIPKSATQKGWVTLQWTRPSGLGGGGRGLQVSEVWLLPEHFK